MEYIGTASQFIKDGLTINNVPVDVVGLSQLLKFGIIETKGKAEKSGKPGRIPTIYVIKPSNTLKVETK